MSVGTSTRCSWSDTQVEAARRNERVSFELGDAMVAVCVCVCVRGSDEESEGGIDSECLIRTSVVCVFGRTAHRLWDVKIFCKLQHKTCDERITLVTVTCACLFFIILFFHTHCAACAGHTHSLTHTRTNNFHFNSHLHLSHYHHHPST